MHLSRWSWRIAAVLIATSAMSAQVSREEAVRLHQQAIQTTIDVFKSGKIEAFAQRIRFPLARHYPLPPVTDAKELEQRYHEIFDAHLSRTIATSTAEKDWEEVGWRGYMLENGLVWADVDGQITGIGHRTKAEQIRRAELIEADRKAVHESLQVFDEPVLKWKTKNHRLRIDRVGDDYRLALWPAGQDFKDTPKLIIEQGSRVHEGSGGNHHYSFPLGENVYICDVVVLGSEEGPRIGSLNVWVDEKPVLSEDVLSEF